jgi:ribose/xylose/arabinose/galactoside ABC-type transport system permease subunit
MLDEPGTPVRRASEQIVLWLNVLGTTLALLLIFAIFCALAPRSFPSVRNIETIARQTTIVAIAAMGATLIIIAGGIDLSVGSQIALVTVVAAKMLQLGFGPWTAAAAGIAAGAACGLLNGILITGLRVVPFIVTLGTLLIVRGAAKGLADEQKIDAPLSWLNNILAAVPQSARDPRMIWLFFWVFALSCAIALALLFTPWRRVGPMLMLVSGVALAWVMRFPTGVWIMFIAVALTGLMLRYTRFGRHVVAIGSNEQTARLCGVPVARVKLLIYMLGGLFAGVAGIMQFSRLTVGDPTVAVGLELDVIAAVVIGGGSLAGGEGSALGSLIGAAIMITMRAGGSHLGWENWKQEIITGGIIIAAVALDRLRHRRAAGE